MFGKELQQGRRQRMYHCISFFSRLFFSKDITLVLVVSGKKKKVEICIKFKRSLSEGLISPKVILAKKRKKELREICFIANDKTYLKSDTARQFYLDTVNVFPAGVLENSVSSGIVTWQ